MGQTYGVIYWSTVAQVDAILILALVTESGLLIRSLAQRRQVPRLSMVSIGVACLCLVGLSLISMQPALDYVSVTEEHGAFSTTGFDLVTFPLGIPSVALGLVTVGGWILSMRYPGASAKED